MQLFPVLDIIIYIVFSVIYYYITLLLASGGRPMFPLACLFLCCHILLMFATTRSVSKSVKVSVVEIAKLNTQIDLTGFRHRASGDKSVRFVVQANRCLTSCGEAPQSVQMPLGSPNTLCL